jgi:cell division protein FtsQ
MTTPSHDDETQELQSGESVHVTGETPVVRSLDDVPVEVLEELTEAFEGISIVDEDGPEFFEGHVLGGYDIVSDDDLTHARRPPLVIEDNEFTQPLERAGDGQPHRRFRLRRIEVRREEGKRRLRVVLYVLVPVLVVAIAVPVLNSPLFGVRTVTVQGAKYLSPEVLAKATAQVKGKSIIFGDLHAAELTLRADPWVRDANVSKHFPSSAIIDIDERQPVAWFLGSDNQSRVLDVEGHVISVQTGQPTQYMQITGVGDALLAGAKANEVYTAAAQLSASLPEEIQKTVLNVGVANNTELLMTLRTGTVVIFGQPSDLRAKLVSLVLVLRRQDPKNLRSIDLSSGDPIFAQK